MYAWEVTYDDVEHILAAHNVRFTPEIYNMIDPEDVENAILGYLQFDNQVVASYSEIERQLIEAGVLNEVKFPLSDIDLLAEEQWSDDDA